MLQVAPRIDQTIVHSFSLSNHAYRCVRQKINEERKEGGSSRDLEKAGQIEKGTSKREKGGLREGRVETRHSIGKPVSGANQFRCIRERNAPDLQMATRNISEQVRSLTKKPFSYRVLYTRK